MLEKKPRLYGAKFGVACLSMVAHRLYRLLACPVSTDDASCGEETYNDLDMRCSYQSVEAYDQGRLD